jgi:peptidoglycan/xylan/chitin deacetylase (PgdA/CDA1 family)
MYLNIVFHRVVVNDDNIKDLYEVTIDQFVDSLNLIRKLTTDKFRFFDSYRLYFDDGDDSFVYKCLPYILKKELYNVVLAIPTDNIDKKGFLTKKDLKLCHDLGIKIASHSVSHPALAFCVDNEVCRTPLDGEYRSVPFGRTAVLSEQEVLYQMAESKKRLNALGYTVKEFVLPYGCYNMDILKINKKYNLYDIISTCERFLDNGFYLRPRILMRHDMTLKELSSLIKTLKPNTFNNSF